MMAGADKFHFRLVLLGSHGTGFLFKRFETVHKPTVEDLFSKSFDLGSIEVKVDFLDTSGSMQFPAMRRLSITTGSAFLIVYAVDDETSYDVLKMCMAEIREIRSDFQEIPIVFAGNKCDIARERQKVLKEVVSNYVYYDLPRLRAKVIECSCRDGINIENIFRAYLPLAKVSLSTASSNIKNQPPDDRTQDNNRRTSSMKGSLGVRKSCDASIVPASKNSPKNHNFKDKTIQASENSISSLESEFSEVNLETAIQSRKQVAKPRSRSLIWRSARKSRTSPVNPECRVT